MVDNARRIPYMGVPTPMVSAVPTREGCICEGCDNPGCHFGGCQGRKPAAGKAGSEKTATAPARSTLFVGGVSGTIEWTAESGWQFVEPEGGVLTSDTTPASQPATA